MVASSKGQPWVFFQAGSAHDSRSRHFPRYLVDKVLATVENLYSEEVNLAAHKIGKEKALHCSASLFVTRRVAKIVLELARNVIVGLLNRFSF